MEWKVIVAFLFAVILVLGCSSSKTSETGTQIETNTNTATNNAASGTNPSFSNLVSMSPLTAYSITYDITTNYGGETQSSTIKEVISGTKTKYDITTENSPVRAVTITTDGKSYTCALGSGQDMCFEMETDSSEQTTTDGASETAKSFENTPNIAYDGTKTIAGVTTYCYTTTNDGADYKFCLDKNHGMLLGMYTTESGTTTEMEATAFSTATPSDSEFALPAPVQTIPSYG
jgi:outer membrane lipoprotein-sorting protein